MLFVRLTFQTNFPPNRVSKSFNKQIFAFPNEPYGLCLPVSFVFSDFSIESEADNYRLHIGGYSGTAGDAFTTHPLDEMAFTTPDRDNDG